MLAFEFERTLLAEHIETLDAVLIHSLRCANLNPNPERAAPSKPWLQRLHDLARFMHIESNSLNFLSTESTKPRPAALN